jgi:hypothetical protein
MACGEAYSLRVAINNRGGRILNSQATPPVLLSYHWFPDALPGAKAVILDGFRTSIRLVSGLNHCVAYVAAPAEPGDYLLQLDLVEENVAWFSDKSPNRRDFPFHAVSVYEKSSQSAR